MPVEEFTLKALEAAYERKQRGLSLQEQAEEWSSSLRLFVEHAWGPLGISDPFVPGWHIDAMCEHLEAVSDGEIRRLAICIPPGSTKSTVTSICWPAWCWSRKPELRFITASYKRSLAERFALQARALMEGPWYQARWGTKFRFKSDQNVKGDYANSRGGRRISLPVNGATGEHGDLLVIDDPHDAAKILSDAEREETIEWHDGTITTRFTSMERGAEVIIAQRLHEKDLIGHVLAKAPEEWTVLCLPARYEPKHKFVAPKKRVLPSGRVVKGDPRDEEGELLSPGRVSESTLRKLELELSAFRAAGQLQQRPAAREGAILKRTGWRFFPDRWLDESERHKLPVFHGLVQSWDTAFRDRSINDFVVGGLWGLSGVNMYLLAIRRERMSLSKTKQAIRDMTAFVEREKLWRQLPLHILVENKSNGPDVIAELRSEIRGVVPYNSVMPDKVARAEAAEPALEGGNVWVPGLADPGQPSFYDPRSTPAFVQELVEECATFPFGDHDDQVDMFTQVVSWSRGAGRRQYARFSRPSGVMPEQGSIADVMV